MKSKKSSVLVTAEILIYYVLEISNEGMIRWWFKYFSLEPETILEVRMGAVDIIVTAKETGQRLELEEGAEEDDLWVKMAAGGGERKGQGRWRLAQKHQISVQQEFSDDETPDWQIEPHSSIPGADAMYDDPGEKDGSGI